MSDARATITRILQRESGGDLADELIPIVYDELHRLAHGLMRNERRGHTLSTTDLVHEAYLRLFDQKRLSWEHRRHFFGYAATAMRAVLIDHARKKAAKRQIGPSKLVPFDLTAEPMQAPEEEVLAVDEALQRLAELDPRQARVVELRYFGGFTETEAAEILDISRTTVSRDFRSARLWLARELGR